MEEGRKGRERCEGLKELYGTGTIGYVTHSKTGDARGRGGADYFIVLYRTRPPRAME